MVALRLSVKTLELSVADLVVPLVDVIPDELRRASVVPLLLTVLSLVAATPEVPVLPPTFLATLPPPAPVLVLLPYR